MAARPREHLRRRRGRGGVLARPPLAARTTTVEAGPVEVVTLGGELDLAAAPGVRERLLGAVGRHLPVVVDLSACSFIDSSCLGVLLAASGRLRDAGCLLVLSAPSPEVAAVLGATRLAAVVPVVPTVEEGVLLAGRHFDGCW